MCSPLYLRRPIFIQKQKTDTAKRLHAEGKSGNSSRNYFLATWIWQSTASVEMNSPVSFPLKRWIWFSGPCVRWTLTNSDKDMANSFTDLEIKRLELVPYISHPLPRASDFPHYYILLLLLWILPRGHCRGACSHWNIFSGYVMLFKVGIFKLWWWKNTVSCCFLML